MSHIDALNAYERSAVYQPFYMLPLAARVLHYRRIEAKAEGSLNDISRCGGRDAWRDEADAAQDDFSDAHEARGKIIAAYLGDRKLRVGVRVAA